MSFPARRVSAPALHPTAHVRPVLLDRLEQQRGPHCWAALALVVAAIWLHADSARLSDLDAVGCVLLAGFVLAAVHEDQPVWDAAMPVDPARYALVGLVCGTVWAAFLLGVVVALYTILFRRPEHPAWYTLALFAWGLASYLLTSAAFLRPPLGVLVYPVLGLLTGFLMVVAGEEAAELRALGWSEALGWTALPLVLAGTAAYTAARFPARAPEPAGPAALQARAPRPDPAREIPDWPAAPAERSARPRVRRAAPARPAATLTVFQRHFALLRRLATVPALMLLFIVLGVLLQLGDGTTVRYFVESAELREWCSSLALSWAALVWLGEHGARRRWNDALPVATAKRRMLHAAAGAAWLLCFVLVVVAAPLAAAAASGTVSSPSDVPMWLWLGLPCMTLALYLAATFVVFAWPATQPPRSGSWPSPPGPR